MRYNSLIPVFKKKARDLRILLVDSPSPNFEVYQTLTTMADTSLWLLRNDIMNAASRATKKEGI